MRKLKRKLIKLIIKGLALTLIITGLFTYRAFKNAESKTIQQNINNPINQEQVYKMIDKQELINKLNLENSLNCLSGNVDVEAKYSNEDIPNSDVNFKWVKTKLAEMNSKDITVNSTYKFTFTYGLKDLPIKVINNTVYIRISPNRLSLMQCELQSTNSIKDRVGLLEGKFNPSELSSINKRTRDLAYNRILSDNSLRDKALVSVQNNIKDLITPLLDEHTNIHFDVSTYDVVQQNEVEIVTR
jgi:hypothetical protein